MCKNNFLVNVLIRQPEATDFGVNINNVLLQNLARYETLNLAGCILMNYRLYGSCGCSLHILSSALWYNS